jgi:Xaa-Pro aminopeptidase
MLDIIKIYISTIREYMVNKNIDALYFEGNETQNLFLLRILSGVPLDSVCFLTKENVYIIPWDFNLIKAYKNEVITIVDTKNRSVAKTILGLPNAKKLNTIGTIGIVELINIDKITPNAFDATRDVYNIVNTMRGIKNDSEFLIIKNAIDITNNITSELKRRIFSNTKITESEIYTIMYELMREEKCFDFAFPPLIANSSRSYCYHPFPNVTNDCFLGNGYNYIDFGVDYGFYKTDITMVFLKRNNDLLNEIMFINDIIAIIEDNINAKKMMGEIEGIVSEEYQKNKFNMCHDFFHGLGLEDHDYPTNAFDLVLQNNAYFAIEPAIYSLDHGGLRLENDYCIREGKLKKLTEAEIITI